jgi:hypothetical protein
LEALQMMFMLPTAPLADAGLNVTVKVALWPAVRVNGVLIPLRLNPLPLMLA